MELLQNSFKRALKAGKAQMDAATAEALVEGRLVFARKNQSK